MLTKPYNLKNGHDNSNEFYHKLADFTSDVLKYSLVKVNESIENFIRYRKKHNLPLFTKEEHFVEFLTIGLLWNNYKQYYSIDAIFYSPLFNFLYNRRKKNQRLKKRIDNIRGKINNKVLLQMKNQEIDIHKRFEYQVSWLSDSKEYELELERMKVWQLWVEQMPITKQEDFWNSTTQLAAWFSIEAEQTLGKYTDGWEGFMMDTINIYSKREDQIFCNRKPNEYHLNMLAAEVINRALEKSASETKEKIVLLPTCMANAENCKAKVIDNKLTCQNCSPTCNVNILSNKLNKDKVSTVLIPHSTGFSRYIRPWKDSKNTSLYGVACVLNVIKGGYEMQALNIPSQCVFLDSCSCKNHWLSGEATQLNHEQLSKVLKVKHAKKQSVNSSC